MKNIILKSSFILALSFFTSFADAQCLINHDPASWNSTYNFAGPYDYVQVFTAPCSGDMDYFELTSTAAGTMPGATLNVYDGNVSNGTPIYTQAYPSITITNPGDPITIVITGSCPLLSGNQYSFRFSADDLDFRYENPGSYAGGHIYQNGSPLATTDFVFDVSIGAACSATSITPDIALLPDVDDECSVTIGTAPTATNNCGSIIDGVPDVSFPITSQGTTLITWTYDDGEGNTTTQTQNVAIADVTAPVPDLAQLPDLTNQCEASALTPPTATDNCGGTITGTTSTTAPISTLGTSTITWTFDDGNGNVTTQTQNVINPTIDNSVNVNGTSLQAVQIADAYQWLDCDNAFAPYAGEINQSYTATTTGYYAVEINLSGCVDTSACILIDFSGIEELTFEDKDLVKIVDFLGRETEFKPNTPLIFIYSDGTIRRVMEFDY